MDSQNKSKKILTSVQAEEQHLLSVSKNMKKTSSTATHKEKSMVSVVDFSAEDQIIRISAKKEVRKSPQNNGSYNIHEEQFELKHNEAQIDEEDEVNLRKNSIPKKKTKAKKNKKGETIKQNISVKSSFSKFDALQKRNLIHNPQGEVQQHCRLCDKTVYKMEEIKAEKNIYHKNCFRCNECNKQLKVDTYQSHEGVLYCTVHFKLLFAPKSVEDIEVIKPQKPELIIRENQPAVLPPDVVRASDKPDLGLEELYQLNVRSRYEAFEQGIVNKSNDQQQKISNNVVSRNASILSKVAKLQQLGTNANNQHELIISDSDDEYNDVIVFEPTSENPNADLIRRNKNEQKRELPIGIGEAMKDIRTLFEIGHGTKREERREERKQEIQNIRSRLFMGKQARIKEMYQQAVAESENGIDKKTNIDIEVNSKSLRERFENGEVYRENQYVNETDGEGSWKPAIEKEADVFESAISKKSRSIFMELDANVVTGKNQNILHSFNNNKRGLQPQKSGAQMNAQLKSELDSDVVKCGETVEDVKIETSEISEKFQFFEKYQSTENKKRVFRITPPREGVVKMPSTDETASNNENAKDDSPDINIILHSRTTSMMLNKFRELEKNPNGCIDNSPKPLKCFTPPPDGNRRLYVEQDSDEYASNDDDDDDGEDEYESNIEDGDDFYNRSHLPKDDEALREARSAARAKQLRIKFEKWQANETDREKTDDITQNKNNVSDENSIESTQSIRERFEKMRNVEKLSQPTRPRYQVNRFV